MTILDNDMFRPLLTVFKMSSRELKVLLYIIYNHLNWHSCVWLHTLSSSQLLYSAFTVADTLYSIINCFFSHSSYLAKNILLTTKTFSSTIHFKLNHWERDLRVQYLLLLSSSNQNRNMSTIYLQSQNTKFYEISSHESHNDTCGHAEEKTKVLN